MLSITSGVDFLIVTAFHYGNPRDKTLMSLKIVKIIIR